MRARATRSMPASTHTSGRDTHACSWLHRRRDRSCRRWSEPLAFQAAAAGKNDFHAMPALLAITQRGVGDGDLLIRLHRGLAPAELGEQERRAILEGPGIIFSRVRGTG